MPYATRFDLEARFGTDEVAQRESVLGSGAVSRALDDADAEINGYLDNRYLTPIAPAPVSIVKRACDIARYNLLGDSASEDARKRYQDAISFLQAIQQGSLNLDGATPKEGGGPEARVELVGKRRVFSRGLV
ncbi:MAG: DUF1320 domain-containing protein [Rhodocyclaceae bacterium]|nr:DUF1320 domain-containing protein [Rhodocyclaceae bacterium]